MNPQDNNTQTPTSPEPIVGEPQPTPGTEQSSPIKKALPRLIIAAILINMIPALFILFGEQYAAMSQTIRNYANIAFIIAFLIIIIRQVTDRGNDA